jgi:PPM family protein phosphatase
MRPQNEDTFLIADLASGTISHPCVETRLQPSAAGYLLLVCDGMGGHAAGEVAARLAASSIKDRLAHDGAQVAEHPGQSLAEAVVGAHQAILAEARANPAERGMGTTCTAAVLLDRRLVLAQVGDSRAYLLRDGTLRPLTRDQTLAAQLEACGALDEEEARTSPLRNTLLQALGARSPVEPAIAELDLTAGDRILICSDGLHGPVAEPAIERTLASAADLTTATSGLVQLALAAGGPDNVTVVVADYAG